MNRRIRCDPGAVLLLGILFFTLTPREIAALIASAAVHESGHLIALLTMGSPLRGVHFTLSGPVIICQYSDSGWKNAFCALSGPFFGLVFAFLLRKTWPLFAEISFWLSILNLIPVLPLDGGRAMQALLSGRYSKLQCVLEILIPAVIMLAGLVLIGRGGNGFGLLMFGAWLLILSCQEHRFDVK